MAYSALGQGLLRLAGMAGKAAPAVKGIVGRVGIPAAVGTAVGAVRGGQQQGLGGVIPGALGGGITGGTLGLVPGARNLNPYMQGAIGTLGGAYGPASMGVVSQGVSQGVPQVGAMGTGLIANQLAGGAPPDFTNQNMMSALPGGFNVGVNPYGQIGDVINPAGALQSGRLNRLYDYDTTVRGMHKIMPAMRMYSEQAKKDDMSRQLAADQLRSNIVQAAQMGLNAQTAGLNQGTTAMNQIGNALTTQYRY